MSVITINFDVSGDELPVSVSLISITRSDTGGTVDVGMPLPADFTGTGGGTHWSLSFAAPAPGLHYDYVRRLTWADAGYDDVPGSVDGPPAVAATAQYLTVPDLKDDYPTALLLELSQYNKNVQTVDDDRLQRAVNAAEADLNGRLARSGFTVPLAGVDDAGRAYLRDVLGMKAIAWLYRKRGGQTLDKNGKPVESPGAGLEKAYTNELLRIKHGGVLAASRTYTAPAGVFAVIADTTKDGSAPLAATVNGELTGG